MLGGDAKQGARERNSAEGETIPDAALHIWGLGEGIKPNPV
jgi:hypothetical protein